MTEYCIFQKFFDVNIYLKRGLGLLNTKNIEEFGMQVPSNFCKNYSLEYMIDHCYLNGLHILKSNRYKELINKEYIIENGYLEILKFIGENYFKINIANIFSHKIFKYFFNLKNYDSKSLSIIKDLYDSVKNNNFYSVKKIFKKILDLKIDLKNLTYYYNFIFEASKISNYEMIDLFYNHGIYTKFNFNELIYHENYKEIKYLLKKGINNTFDINGDHVYNNLSTAVKTGNLKIIKLLLDYNPDINIYNTEVLFYCNSLKIFKFLIKKGANINSRNGSILQNCCEYNKLKIAKYLLKKKLYYPTDLSFNLACEKGHFKIVKLLVENGYDINSDYNSGFLIACEKGNYKIVKYLIEKGINVNKIPKNYNFFPLYRAAKYNKLSIVKLLVDNGADISYNNTMVLFDCYSLNIFKFLIEKGADITARNNTLFGIICDKNLIDHAKILININPEYLKDPAYLRACNKNYHFGLLRPNY